MLRCLNRRLERKRVVSLWKMIYSYENMRADIEELRKRYGGILDVVVLERTADQRNVFCIRIGNPMADHSFVVDAALHGREWLNTQVLMRILEDDCRILTGKTYKGRFYRKILDKVCLYILPMVNPDGVSISQYGVAIIRDNRLREAIMGMPKESYYRWKANARGVDLNRNFTIDFKQNLEKQPSAQEYGGEKPLSEQETKALVRLVENVHPKAVIHYHEAGSLIFYQKKSPIIKKISHITHYPTRKEDEPAPGCFSSWLTGQGIVSCTVETCHGKAPAPHWQIFLVYIRNRKILMEVMKKGLHYL